MAGVSDQARPGWITAVLGPTNTGKTHYAVTRMLANPTGMIGLPLRLLAREVYDRVVARVGAASTALMTGEEKIIPKNVRFWVCTVESMPMDISVDFLAVDEIQLAQDPERGHVFTDRLLHARGRHETMFMGASTMAPLLQRLVPELTIQSRERMSTLSYGGIKKISRLPRRSAIVAFSANEVYEIAEWIRRQKGGAAVVLGALSPRTRNAQVALYEEGEVDYLVATDAIGMGLNMDVHHVAFAGLEKFDGKLVRRLRDDELAQIAGRAGRFQRDGSFGTTGSAEDLNPETIEHIEEHRFPPVTQVCWRNGILDYRSPQALLSSLERGSSQDILIRGREASDALTLRQMSRDEDIQKRAQSLSRTKLLWDVAQIPDFRKTLHSEHVVLLMEAFKQLCDQGHLLEDWIAGHVGRLDRFDGGIDALQTRLAFIRTWTYMSHRPNWLRDSKYWQQRTRDIEDKLSDALHESLMGRFVDRRTSVLMKRLREKQDLMAEVDDDGNITVEGEVVGKLDGFRFSADTSSGDIHAKTLKAAAAQVLADQLTRRANQLAGAKNPISIAIDGGILWSGSIIGRLEKGDAPLRPRVQLYVDDHMPAPIRDKLREHIEGRVTQEIDNRLGPLRKMESGEELTANARAMAFRLYEAKGCLMRRDVQDLMASLGQEDRQGLRGLGTRFAQHAIYLPLLLKPHALTLKAALWALFEGKPAIEPPPPGLVTITRDPQLPNSYYHENGFMPFQRVAARVDMTDRLTESIRKECDNESQTPKGMFIITPDLMSLVGRSGEDFEDILKGLGYRETEPFTPKAEEEAIATDNTSTAEEASSQEASISATPDATEENEAHQHGQDGEISQAQTAEGQHEHLTDKEQVLEPGPQEGQEAAPLADTVSSPMVDESAPSGHLNEREDDAKSITEQDENAAVGQSDGLVSTSENEGVSPTEEPDAKPIMLWRFRPPRPERRDGNRGRRAAFSNPTYGQKDNAEKGDGREERRPQKAYKDNQKPRSKPTHGEDGGSKRPRGKKPRPQDQRTPSRMEAKPQGKPASIDPDSPFAVLAKFKNR